MADTMAMFERYKYAVYRLALSYAAPSAAAYQAGQPYGSIPAMVPQRRKAAERL